MYLIYFVRTFIENIATTYTIFYRKRTGVDFNDMYKFRYIKDVLTLQKFTSNQYRPLTVMYRISFEWPLENV